MCASHVLGCAASSTTAPRAGAGRGGSQRALCLLKGAAAPSGLVGCDALDSGSSRCDGLHAHLCPGDDDRTRSVMEGAHAALAEECGLERSSDP